MSRSRLLLLCYDGRTSQSSQGITFDDATPVTIEIDRGAYHSVFSGKLFNCFGINCEDRRELKITCRYFANSHDQFVAFPVVNDESVDIMLDKTEEEGVYRVEIHIEDKSHELVGSQSDDIVASQSDVCLFETGDGNDRGRNPSYALFFVDLPDGKLQMCRMKLETPVRKLVTAFAYRGYKDMRFIYNSRQLEEHRTLKECSICNDCFVHAVGRLRGD